jgi:hypothetical protein
VIIFSTRDVTGAGGHTTRVYDVRGLLQEAARMHEEITDAHPLNANAAQSALASPADLEADRVHELLTLVIDHVSPETWVDNGGADGRCTYWAGQLIVTQTERGQQDVETFLELLRRRN